MSTMGVRATPFHARAAVLNGGNVWQNRNGWTFAADYGDAGAEALAARTTAVMADISWRWRVRIEGARAGEFLSRLCTKNAAPLEPGMALKALWLSDGGGVRGAGAVARLGAESFLLAASAPDPGWIENAAARFGATVRDVTQEEGGLALIGPYAGEILKAAGLDGEMEPLALRKLFWRDLDITLSRLGEHDGYELWCKADDAPIVWDRIARAGVPFALRPAGLAAMDVLDLEKGVARAGRDYETARDGFSSAPTPPSLGLERLIDRDHLIFNGRAGWLAAREKETKRLVGIALDSEDAVAKGLLQSSGQIAGRVLAAGLSPALRRAIALAQVEAPFAKPGTTLSLASSEGPVLAHVADLPFLATPEKTRSGASIR